MVARFLLHPFTTNRIDFALFRSRMKVSRKLASGESVGTEGCIPAAWGGNRIARALMRVVPLTRGNLDVM